MKQKVIAFFITIGIIASIFSPFPAWAQVPTPSPASPTPILTPTLKQLVTEDETFRYWRDAAKGYEAKVDQERQNFYAYTSGWLAFIAFVAALLLGGGVFTYVSIFREARQFFSNIIEEQGGALKKKVKKWISERLQEEFSLQSQIVILASEDRHDEIEDSETSLLNQRGFKNVEVRLLDADISDADLVIFEFAKGREEQLTAVTKKVEKNSTPLLVYSQDPKVRVSAPRFDKYKLRALANTPLTLVSWTFSILASYRKE